MKTTHHAWLLVILAFATYSSASLALGAEEAASSGDMSQIQAAITSYIEAFNARDVDRLIDHWSPNGVYINATTGEAIAGHEAMTEEFTEILEKAGAPKLAVTTTSIEFISPNVALERGLATVTRRGSAEGLPEGEDAQTEHSETTETSYRVVYVKNKDRWLIDRVSEDDVPPQNQHYEKLRSLEWMIGDWIQQDERFVVEISCNWTTNQNFISRTYTVTVDGETESSGLQIIGWDARKDEIQSWLFDSDGGVVTGQWSKSDEHWVVQSVVSLADGGRGSFTSIFRPLGDGAYAWQKVNRVIDGELQPSTADVVFERQ